MAESEGGDLGAEAGAGGILGREQGSGRQGNKVQAQS